MMIQEGDYFSIFTFISRPIAVIVLAIIVTILGPLAGIPRCLALISALNNTYIPLAEKTTFIIPLFICLLAYYLVVNRGNLIDIIGKFLAPMKIAALFVVIIVGLWTSGKIGASSHISIEQVKTALGMGYNTMDLLAGIFFANMIYSHLRIKFKEHQVIDRKEQIKVALKASLVCSLLLIIIYSLFALVAAGHASSLASAGIASIIKVLSQQILGVEGGILVCMAVTLACFVTVVALTTITADFIFRTFLQKKVRYKICVIGVLAISFLVSEQGFSSIVALATPVLEVIYPGIVALLVLSHLSKFLTKKLKKRI